MRSSHAEGAGFPASVGVIQRGREHENSATVRDVRRTLYSSQRTPRTRSPAIYWVFYLSFVSMAVSRRSNKLRVAGSGLTCAMPRHAGCLIRRHPFFFEARDTMVGTYLMALFAMLFAASTALTLIHFVSHLDKIGRASCRERV